MVVPAQQRCGQRLTVQVHSPLFFLSGFHSGLPHPSHLIGVSSSSAALSSFFCFSFFCFSFFCFSCCCGGRIGKEAG